MTKKRNKSDEAPNLSDLQSDLASVVMKLRGMAHLIGADRSEDNDRHIFESREGISLILNDLATDARIIAHEIDTLSIIGTRRKFK